MTLRSLYLRLTVATFLALMTSCLWAQDGLQGALSQGSLNPRLGGSLAVADLDGDHQPDGAVLVQSGWSSSQNFRIQLHFTSHTNVEIAFQSTKTTLAVMAWDIDNDGDYDLVVEEALTHKPLRVWINDGNGGFHEGRIQDFPSLAPGTQEQLRSPANRADCPTLSLPPQRGFEAPLLAAGMLARPPSNSRSKALSTVSFTKLQARALNSSRAPPLS